MFSGLFFGPFFGQLFGQLFGQGLAAAEVLALSAMALLAGCSSPKAVVPAVQSGSALTRAAGSANLAGAAHVPASDPFVAAVRAGTMSGYPQASIGQAFEAAFRGAQWRSQQPDGGARVVTFTGFLPANMQPECSAPKAGSPAPPCAQDAKATFEWTFTSDGSFHLSHVDPEPWPEDRRSTRDMMLYIFG
jgi:hypothetical protein